MYIPRGQCPSFLSPALPSAEPPGERGILFRGYDLLPCQSLDVRRLRCARGVARGAEGGGREHLQGGLAVAAAGTGGGGERRGRVEGVAREACS